MSLLAPLTDNMNFNKNTPLVKYNNVQKRNSAGDHQLANQNPANKKQNTNFKQHQHFCEGDILEVRVNASTEYLIFLGQVGTKQNVLYAVYDTTYRNTQPTLFQRWWSGAEQVEEQPFSKNSAALSKKLTEYGNGVQHILIRQAAIEELFSSAHYSIKVNNFDHVNLEPNNPTAILDRAMFKVSDSKTSPHFQNSKDWVIWCRYGRDIITKVHKMPSHFDLAVNSGKC